MCRILIEIEGGIITQITTDKEMEVVIVDHDLFLESEPMVIVHDPDTIIQGGEKFSKSFLQSLDEYEQGIGEELKKLNL